MIERNTMVLRILIVPLFLVAACSAASYQKALDTSLAATNGAFATLEKYSDAEQGRIVAVPRPEVEKAAALAAFRAKRAPVLAAFVLAYTAISVAATKGDAASIAAAAQAVVDAYNAVRALLGGGS